MRTCLRRLLVPAATAERPAVDLKAGVERSHVLKATTRARNSPSPVGGGNAPMKNTILRLLAIGAFLPAYLPAQLTHTDALAAQAATDLRQFVSGGHVLGFNPRGFYLASGSHVLHVEFLGARAVQPVANASGSPDGKAPALGQVTYPGLWDGITLTYASSEAGIYETTYRLAPGADPAAIRLRYSVPPTLEPSGTLSIPYDAGSMTESAPVAWQEIDSRRVPVEVAYGTRGKEVFFIIGAYDPGVELTIDPVLTWNALLGGGGADYGYDIALDTSRNVYVAGYSESSWGSPARPYSGGTDAFVAKFTNSGSLSWVTFVGGSGFDQGLDIALDSDRNVYLAGYSSASWGSPVGAFNGYLDAYVAKLSSSGGLVWNTFLGSAGTDVATGLSTNGDAEVYVGGYSSATWGSPVREYTSGDDAFAARLSSLGELEWNTFLGGSSNDYGDDIVLDGDENVHVVGSSYATWGSPVRVYTADNDCFVAELTSSGELNWNTFLGGSGHDRGNAVALDGDAGVYVAGYSGATWGTPILAHAGGDDAFAAKLNSSGGLMWNTFLGGTAFDIGTGIAVDNGWRVYVTGTSNRTWGSPVLPFAGSADAFVVKLSNSGALTWNSFLGSSADDSGRSIAVDDSGNSYECGTSSASWGTPVRGFAGGQDAQIAELGTSGALIWNTFVGASIDIFLPLILRK